MTPDQYDDSEEDSDDGPFGDFSMENYTIDLAVLARRESGRIGRMVADEQNEEEFDGGEGQGLNDANGDGQLEEEEGERDHEGKVVEQCRILEDYEIDLGGLGDKPSSVVVEDRQEEREEVASEADGPEDFTLNMEAWMRENGKAVKAGDVPSDLDEQRSGLKHELQDATLDFGHEDESILDPLEISTPFTKNNDVDHVEAQEEAHADKRPLFIRGETELQQNQAAEEVFERISALQAEVEEMRKAEEKRRSAYQRLTQENALLRKDQARLGFLEGDNSKLRKQNADLQAKIQERKLDFAATASAMGSPSPGESLEVEQHFIASDEKIQTLEAGLKASHSMVRKLREEMGEDDAIHRVKVEGLKEDLERIHAEIDVKNGQIADFEQDADTQTEIVKHRDQLIARLTTDAQVAHTELERVQQEARESRRIAQSIEEENDRLTTHNRQQTEDMAATEDALQGKVREIQTAHATIAALQDTLQGAVVYDENVSSPEKVSHEAALDALKQAHSTTVTSLNQKFARQLQLFKQDRDTQASKHAAELAKAKEKPSPNTAMETELRSAIRVLSSKLEKANNAAREGKSELEKTQADLQDARQAIEATKRDNELTNAELDARFTKTMNAREREWRRRVALLFRERATMGKALMAGWGREDVGKGVRGDDRGQAYRYRFVARRDLSDNLDIDP